MKINCVIAEFNEFRYMHGRNKTDEQGNVESLEMPVPSTSGGRTRRTGLLTVMERPPGNYHLA